MTVIDVAATGNNLRTMCISAGVTPKDMQDACGLTTRNAVYKWFNGTAVPNIDNLVIIADVLGTTIDKIICIRRY